MADVTGAALAFVAAGTVLGAFERLLKIRDEFRVGRSKYALLTSLWLRMCLPDALDVMHRIENYVLRASDEQVVAYMQSYTSSFNMIGVAGAIIAQVAISAISLTGLESSHWTAEAFFIASLVTGCLSVFFSCAINPAFHGLHSAQDIKDFLTKPMPASNAKNYELIMSTVIGSSGSIPDLNDVTFDYMKRVIEAQLWKVASPYAAIMLVVPMTLLSSALNTFLIGMGIYLGKLYTAKLIPSYGNGNLGILLLYLCSALFGIGMYYIPESLKQQEATPLEPWRRIEKQHEVNRKKRQQTEINETYESNDAIPLENPPRSSTVEACLRRNQSPLYCLW